MICLCVDGRLKKSSARKPYRSNPREQKAENSSTNEKWAAQNQPSSERRGVCALTMT